jgi:hypothetical protein
MNTPIDIGHDHLTDLGGRAHRARRTTLIT